MGPNWRNLGTLSPLLSLSLSSPLSFPLPPYLPSSQYGQHIISCYPSRQETLKPLAKTVRLIMSDTVSQLPSKAATAPPACLRSPEQLEREQVLQQWASWGQCSAHLERRGSRKMLSMVVHSFNPSTQETEAGGSPKGQPDLQR